MTAATIADQTFTMPTHCTRADIEGALNVLKQNLTFDHSESCPPLTLEGIIPDNAIDQFLSEPSQPHYPLHRDTQKKIIALCHIAAKRRILAQHPPSKDKPETYTSR